MQEKPHVAATAEVREALLELQQYLSDTIAPLMVADSIELLSRAPAELTAAQIHAWSTSQYKGLGASVPVSDYLFHAMKKIHLMGEYDLVSRESLIRFLHELARHLLAYCPPEDRELLRTNIGRLGEATTILSSPVEFLHRQAGSGAQPLASAQPVASGGTAPLASQGVAGGGAGATVPLTPDLARGLRGFGLLLERLERTTGRGEAEGREILSQLLTMAAVNSQSEPELEQHLEQLRDLGLERRPRDLFRDLGRSLPDWNIPQVSGGDDALPMNPLGPIEAMHNLIALAEDPNEGALRFREMVQAAIEQFNEGSLGRAATMLELAERIIVEKKVDYTAVESVRKTSAELLNGEMLRQFSENSDKHPALRKVMNFFSLLKPEGLLHELQIEEKREKRRLALALLEAHGATARLAAQKFLREVTSDPANDHERYFTRNLIYLLRRIAVPADVELEEEVTAISAMLNPNAPIHLLKEAVAYLGQTRNEKAERALIAFVGDLESILTSGNDSPFDPQEIRQLLDRTVSALARSGGADSARAIVSHAMKRDPNLGETVARLTDLGARDLSSDPEVVEKLLKWLRGELPMRILGFVVQRATVNLFYLIDALAGTEAAAVRSTFEEIAARYPNEDFGKAAANALAGFGATPRTAEPAPSIALSGDLEIFGLPNLLQTLAESNVSGVLTLKDTEADVMGMIAFDQGRIQEAQAGKLRGPEAVYQLFERPRPGTFAFVNRTTPQKDRAGTSLEVIPVLFEAMRRYDEFRQARLLVPDESGFEVSGIRPTSPADERDPALARVVWNKIRSGATAAECEVDVAADSFRVRRMLVHWVDQGALQQI